MSGRDCGSDCDGLTIEEQAVHCAGAFDLTKPSESLDVIERRVAHHLAAAFRAGLERAYPELCRGCRRGWPVVKADGLWWHDAADEWEHCEAGILREQAAP